VTPGRPESDEFAPYYTGYVSRVTEEDVVGALEKQVRDVRSTLQAFSGERESFAYAPGKWSVRQVAGHLVDAERVFGYRAFCISRGEQAALPSFDENAYVVQSDTGRRLLADVVAELAHVRESNLIVLRNLDAEAWSRRGTASGHPVSVRALAYIMAGHIRHHLEILRERY
jgi:hypothetical protein